MTINVRFTDSTQQVIDMYFGCPQDTTIYPNQGQIGPEDPRWKAFYDAIVDSLKGNLPAPAGS